MENIVFKVDEVIFSPFSMTFFFFVFISHSNNSYSNNLLVVFSTISFNLLSCCL
jgi:hypothetical protein